MLSQKNFNYSNRRVRERGSRWDRVSQMTQTHFDFLIVHETEIGRSILRKVMNKKGTKNQNEMLSFE